MEGTSQERQGRTGQGRLEEGLVSAKIAEAISQQLAAAITRNVIMGVYDRQQKLRKTHPLGGAGAAKQRLNAEKRARLTPQEREAKIKEREARKKEREARQKEREEKERRKQEPGQRHLSGPTPPRQPTPLESSRAPSPMTKPRSGCR